MWKFVLLLLLVAVASYYSARFLLEGRPRRRAPQEDTYVRPLGPDDDDEFLSRIAKRPDGPSTPDDSA